MTRETKGQSGSQTNRERHRQGQATQPYFSCGSITRNRNRNQPTIGPSLASKYGVHRNDHSDRLTSRQVRILPVQNFHHNVDAENTARPGRSVETAQRNVGNSNSELTSAPDHLGIDATIQLGERPQPINVNANASNGGRGGVQVLKETIVRQAIQLGEKDQEIKDLKKEIEELKRKLT